MMGVHDQSGKKRPVRRGGHQDANKGLMTSAELHRVFSYKDLSE